MIEAKGRRLVLATANLLAVLALSACAWLPPTPQTDLLLEHPRAEWPRQMERQDLPTILQEPDYCGPAALAMALGQAGKHITQDDVAQKVFLPSRSGSLQTDMLAGARQYGFVPFLLDGQLSSLLAETSAGRSPVALLNLGLDWAPRWHYVVILGYDLDRADILLRSGTNAQEVMPLRTFEYTWARAKHWAMVVAAPGVIPHGVTAEQAEQAALGFERVNPPQAASVVWQSVNRQWPQRSLPYFGLGNALLASGQAQQALKPFEQAASQFDSPAAWNNLAQTRLNLGDRSGALVAARRAMVLAQGNDSRWIDAIMATLHSIEQTPDTPCTDKSKGC